MTISGFMWRRAMDSPGVLLALSLVVAVLSGLVASGPIFAGRLNDAQLDHRLESLSALQGDVSASWVTFSAQSVTAGPSPLGSLREAAEEMRAGLDTPLQTVLEPAQFVAFPDKSTRLQYEPPAETGYYLATLTPVLDPDLLEHTRIVDGSTPELTNTTETVQVGVLAETATQLGLGIGDVISPGFPFVVSSIHEVLVPEDPRWDHHPYGVRNAELLDPNRGVALEAGMFLAPDGTGNVVPGVGNAIRVELWFATALQADGITVPTLRTQLSGLLARNHEFSIPTGFDGELTAVDLSFESALGLALDDVSRQQAVSNSMLLVLAVGPAALGVVLLVLVTRVITHRREQTTHLLIARGAATQQLRRQAVGEGLALGVPAACLGHVTALLLLGTSGGWWQWILTLVVGSAPALALQQGVPSASPTAARRSDIGAKAGRGRLLAELLLLLLAGLAVWQLLSPDSTMADARSGVDPLATAAPILVAAAGGLFALRLHPLPLTAFANWFRGRSGLVGFLGSVRGLRSPAGGLVPMFAMLIGTTIAILSTVLVGTMQAGIQTGVAERNGAHLNLSGPPMTPELVEQLTAVDGVEHVALLYDTRERRGLQVGQDQVAVSVWLADASLDDVYDPALGLPDLTSGLVSGGAIPMSPDGTVTLAGFGDSIQLDHWQTLPGTPASGEWVLLDAESWESAGGSRGMSRLALISLTTAADATGVAAQVQAIAGGLVTTTTDQLEDARSQPVVQGLGVVLPVIAGFTLLLMLVAIITSQQMASVERQRLAGILGVLGAPRGTVRALAAWELVPVMVTSLLLGTVLGFGSAAVMIAGLDFRIVTGGLRQPPLSFNPLLLGGVALVIAIVAALTVLASSKRAGSTDLAQQTREAS